jgi:hypothetical protein
MLYLPQYKNGGMLGKAEPVLHESITWAANLRTSQSVASLNMSVSFLGPTQKVEVAFLYNYSHLASSALYEHLSGKESQLVVSS